jgi:hypothetical protein
MPVPDAYLFGSTLGQLAMGRHDPCAKAVGGAFWWATRTPDGPATLALRRSSDGLLAEGYGPGADWVVERADAVAGPCAGSGCPPPAGCSPGCCATSSSRR